MDIVSAFLGVIAIIGIIIVGGFVIFFLGDLVLSVLDPNYSRFGKKRVEQKEEIKQITAPSVEKYIEFSPKQEEIKEEKVVIEQGIGDDFFKDVKKEEVQKVEQSNLEDLRSEEERFRANMLKAIEERRQKQEAKAEAEVDFEKFFFGDEDINVFNNEKLKDSEVEEVEVVEQQVSEITDENKDEDKDEDFDAVRDEYEAIIAKLENEKLAVEQEKERLAQEHLQTKEEIAKLLEEKLNISHEIKETASDKSKCVLTVEEYEEQLEKLEERLAENEKDFRRIKKDFIPLRKVHNTLESDDKKLRRREAIVAKQKVELYGVNNIVDIDQEKAKKLTEDLDLLEGLKLSVKHCEEVMAANKERYPILEKIYDVLSKDNKELKADIQEIQEKIAKLKADAE